MTIKADVLEVKCHKIVLCQHSEYFKALCGPDSKFKEQQDPIIELHGDSKDALTAVLCHLYNFTYAEITEKAGGSDILLHMDVIEASQKYLLPDLEKQAFEGLEREISVMTEECKKSGDAADMLGLLKFLAEQSDRNYRAKSRMARLVETHLATLFKIAEFRELIETKPWSDALKLCIETMEDGHNTRQELKTLVGGKKKNTKFSPRVMVCCTCSYHFGASPWSLHLCPSCGSTDARVSEA